MELIRKLLLYYENDEKDPEILDDYTALQRVYHTNLLVEAGFLCRVDAIPVRSGPSFDQVVARFDVERITWAGHDFLDAARNDTIWNRVMNRTGSVVGSVSIAVLKDLLEKALRGELTE